MICFLEGHGHCHFDVPAAMCGPIAGAALPSAARAEDVEAQVSEQGFEEPAPQAGIAEPLEDAPEVRPPVQVLVAVFLIDAGVAVLVIERTLWGSERTA